MADAFFVYFSVRGEATCARFESRDSAMLAARRFRDEGFDPVLAGPGGVMQDWASGITNRTREMVDDRDREILGADDA